MTSGGLTPSTPTPSRVLSPSPPPTPRTFSLWRPRRRKSRSHRRPASRRRGIGALMGTSPNSRSPQSPSPPKSPSKQRQEVAPASSKSQAAADPAASKFHHAAVSCCHRVACAVPLSCRRRRRRMRRREAMGVAAISVLASYRLCRGCREQPTRIVIMCLSLINEIRGECLTGIDKAPATYSSSTKSYLKTSRQKIRIKTRTTIMGRGSRIPRRVV